MDTEKENQEVNLLRFVQKMNKVNSEKFDIQNMLRLSVKVQYLLDKQHEVVEKLK